MAVTSAPSAMVRSAASAGDVAMTNTLANTANSFRISISRLTLRAYTTYSRSMATDSTQMIEKLVGFPTVSRESNLELIDFVHEYLRAYDADVRLTFDDDRRKANLFATL